MGLYYPLFGHLWHQFHPIFSVRYTITRNVTIYRSTSEEGDENIVILSIHISVLDHFSDSHKELEKEENIDCLKRS